MASDGQPFTDHQSLFTSLFRGNALRYPLRKSVRHDLDLRLGDALFRSGERNRFVVMRFELANLFALFKVGCDRFAGERAHLAKSKRRADPVLHRGGQRFAITLLNVQTASTLLDGFGDST